MKKLTHGLLTEKEKRQICDWHYAGDYGIYDLPSYEEMKDRSMGFLNPEREGNFRGFWEGDSLVGYVNMREEEKEVFIGIGVAPELCGQGYGGEILKEAFCIAGKRYPGKPLYLLVRSWNKRAIRCYEKAGFVIAGDTLEKETPAGGESFYRMIRT